MPESEVDYGRKWAVLLAVGAGLLLSALDTSIVNVALPTLTRSFGAEFAVVQWVVLAYLLTVSTLMLAIGRWADMVGKKPIYTAGFVIFTFGSALCGLAPGVYWLIAFRVLQAVGAAMLLALGVAIITEAFPAGERGRALGIGGAVISLGVVAGPAVGGLLIDAFSWHWIFIVNVPIGLAGALLAARLIPNLRPPGGERFDVAGALSLFVSLLALLLALTIGQNLGFSDARILALFGLWLLFLGLFLLVELRARHAMIDLRLFTNRALNVNLLTGYSTFVAISGSILLLPFYLEQVLGYTPRQVGLLMAVPPVVLAVVAPLSGALSDRFGSRPITVIGLAWLALGYGALSTLGANTSPAGFLLRLLPVGIGMGAFQSPNNSAIMGAAPRGRLGVVSGLLAVSRTLGHTTGIAILGALWAARVFHHAGTAPAGGPTRAPAAAQTAGLQDTLLAAAALMGLALGLSLWAFYLERQGRAAAARRQAYEPADG
ncbi:MAG: MFS transporter [Candidatus Promineifilaceae bacterium]